MAAAAIAIAARMKLKAQEKPEKTESELIEMVKDQDDGTLDEEQIPKYRDPEQFGLLKPYIKFSLKVHEFTQGDPFNNFILFIIIVAGFLVGLQTDEALAVDAGVVMTDNIVLGIFIFECFVKMLAEGSRPWMYFCNKDRAWNVFDFTIVVLCLPIWNEYLGDNAGAVALLRLMRLMRVMKIIKKIPQLQMIIMGLVGGMKSIMYILILLLLVFYLFAIVGIFMFRPNDPFHFGDLFTALLTLFRW